MKLTISKSKYSESFYISRSFIDSSGKSTSKIHRKLGTLKELSEKLGTDRDGVVLWAKEQVRSATEEYNRQNESVSVLLSPAQRIDRDRRNSFNCGYLFLQSLLSDLHFHNIFRNISGRHKNSYSLEAVASDLIYARFLKPCSKRSSFYFAHSLLEQPRYDLHQVYRALSILASECDYIQSELYRNSNHIHKRNAKILYYDCTNYYFEAEQEDNIRKYGKSKENRPNPIVGMGLFMDADGYPLAFDLYPGNQNEQKTLKPLEQKVIRDFDCSRFIYCSDSGLASQNNKLFNDTGGRSYVITQSLKKMKKENRETALSPLQYRKVGSTEFIDLRELDETDSEVFNSIYYKEIPVESSKISETVIVTYSPKYRAYQARIRQGQIERAERMITEKGKIRKNRKNPNDPARFIKKTSVTENGEVADKEFCTVSQEAIDKEAMYDGFYAVATDLDGDISEIIEINKRRWQIEGCFKIMKSDFEARPIYVHREDCIKAHFLICFIALLLYRLTDTKLEHRYTTENITDTIRDMRVVLLEGYGYIPAYMRTALTDDLHDIFGFRTDTQIIKKAKMRNIIRKTKER